MIAHPVLHRRALRALVDGQFEARDRRDWSRAAHGPTGAESSCANPGLGKCTGGVNRRCPLAFPSSLVGAGDLKAQLLAALLEPIATRHVRRHGQFGLGKVATRVQHFAAPVQAKKTVHMAASRKRTGFPLHANLLVFEYSQIRQHELGPVLPEIAKKHEAQTLAHLDHFEPEHSVGCFGPVLELRQLESRIEQTGEQRRLGYPGAVFRQTEVVRHLGFAVQNQQVPHRQCGTSLHPLQTGQRPHGRFDVANFRIDQTSGPK
jgi:hypothetical protein